MTDEKVMKRICSEKGIRIEIVVAVCKNFGIGWVPRDTPPYDQEHGKLDVCTNDDDRARLPWEREPADMRRFRDLTLGQVVVMGRETYFSLPESHRPLPKRFNLVVTRNAAKYRHDMSSSGPAVAVSDAVCRAGSVTFVSPYELDAYLESCCIAPHIRIMVIGGQALYARFLPLATKVHLTYFDRDFAPLVNRFFPVEKGFSADAFRLVATAPPCPSAISASHPSNRGCVMRFLEYERARASSREEKEDAAPLRDIDNTEMETEIDTLHTNERGYLRLLRRLLKRGEHRPDRTGVGASSLFGEQLSFDLSGGQVPALTTKTLAWKTVVRELLWFLSGCTNVKRLEAQGVRIWSANASRSFLDGRGLHGYAEGDVGPLYPFALRHFGAPYAGCQADYSGQGIDQMERLVQGMRADPYSRRHLVTTFDPSTVDACALPPCHGIAIQFYVDAEKGVSCHVYCRSSDAFLGLPFNVASYGLLAHIVAKRVSPLHFARRLIVSMGDVHLYDNHREQAEIQIRRVPLPFPALRLSDAVATKAWEDLSLDEGDFELVGYLHHPAISAPMAV